MSGHDIAPIGRELKERFAKDLTPSEKLFFLKKAREAVVLKRYQAGEDLFHYCYFLTLRERLRSITPQRGEGYLRFLLVGGMKDIEDAVRLYENRLRTKRLPRPDEKAEQFIEYLSR